VLVCLQLRFPVKRLGVPCAMWLSTCPLSRDFQAMLTFCLAQCRVILQSDKKRHVTSSSEHLPADKQRSSMPPSACP
jgi:hypothetical protein